MTVVVQPHEINGKSLRRERTTLMREPAAPVMRVVRWTVGGKPAIAAHRRLNPNSLSADGHGREVQTGRRRVSFGCALDAVSNVFRG